MTTAAWEFILLRADSEIYLVNNTYVTVDQDVRFTGADVGTEGQRKRKEKEQEDIALTNARRRKMIDRISRGLPAEEPEPEPEKFVVKPAPEFVPKQKVQPTITDEAFIFPPLNITTEEMETVLRTAAEYRHQLMLSRRRALLASLKGKK